MCPFRLWLRIPLDRDLIRPTTLFLLHIADTMIQGTVLFALLVSVMGFTPDIRFMNEKRGNEIAKMAMNQQKSVSHIFAPNARTCFNSDCSSGVHVYDGYNDKFQQFSIAYTNLIARGIFLDLMKI